MSNEQDKIDTDNTLKEFGKCCVAMCEVLHQNRALGPMELLFIDNHIQIVQMAYLQWKNKHKAKL